MHELPHHPDLRHLRRQAREVQRETRMPLQLAQQALASSYGFGGWTEMKRTIEAGRTVREWAARLLGKRAFEALRARGLTPPPAAILPALRHPDPRVRYECLGLLDHLADEESVAEMIVATTDPVPRVRRMAVHALGCHGCKPVALCADLNSVFLPIAECDPVWRVRQEAIISIAQQHPTTHTRAALDRIVTSDSHPTVRKQALWALGHQKGLGLRG